MFIAATRLPSQWFSLNTQFTLATTNQEDGNPIDRLIYTTLIVSSICILTSRSIRWRMFLRQNSVLITFLSYCLVSSLWSDFPLIALKRWFRDIGDYLVVLVILSDPRPVAAAQIVLRRLCYLVIPLSVLFVKYYPHLSIHYDAWTGVPEYIGATTSKNTLGGVCLVSGLVFFWDTVLRWPQRRKKGVKTLILLNVAFIVMSLYLLHLCNSVTSEVCLALGCCVILGAYSDWVRRYSKQFLLLMPASFLFYLVLDFGLGMNGEMAEKLGRNPNLTGRTEIWATLLSVRINPVFGTGYETFWLGPRLQWIWEQRGHINEAHNGYLDVYLNLGFVGLSLLLLLLIVTYRNAWRSFKRGSPLGSFGLAMWTLLLFYCMSEAAFKNGLLWMVLLLTSVVVPRAVTVRKKPSLRATGAALAGVAFDGAIVHRPLVERRTGTEKHSRVHGGARAYEEGVNPMGGIR